MNKNNIFLSAFYYIHAFINCFVIIIFPCSVVVGYESPKSKHFPEASKTFRPFTIRFMFLEIPFSFISMIKIYFSLEMPLDISLTRIPFFISIQIFNKMFSIESPSLAGFRFLNKPDDIFHKYFFTPKIIFFRICILIAGL